jgi:DNA-binding CsgD family transcriptional regulator
MPLSTGNSLLGAARVLIQSLSSATTSDDFCKMVVHNLLANQEANSCFVAILGSNSNIQNVGSYGYERGVFEQSPLSVWEPSGISSAIRTGEIQRYDSQIEYSAAYDNNRFTGLPGNGYIAIPFISSGHAIGGIGISFQLKLSEIDLPEELLDLIQLAAQVFVSAAITPTKAASAFSFERHNQPEAAKLSDREELILGLMAKGMTNQEIGLAMHLSESSIRSASVGLFRTLGVHSRKDAVAAARHMGLLVEEVTEIAPPPLKVRLTA